MKIFTSIYLVFLFVGCQNNSTTISHKVIEKYVVDSVVNIGQRSTIEPNIYWRVYTSDGKVFQTKQPDKYLKGDTIIVETINETRNF